MSYAIGHLIFGLPVIEEVSAKANELNLDLGNNDGEEFDPEFHDNEGVGFDLLYTGADYDAGFIGTELLEFDVCVDFHRFSQLEEAKKTLTPEMHREVDEKLRKFSYTYPDLAQIYIDKGVLMDYYIVWSYS